MCALHSPDAEKKSRSIPSNLRLLAVLEEIARIGLPVTPGEVAARLDIPKSSVYRLFSTLEKEGFIHREVNECTYAIGQRLRKFAGNTLSCMHIRTARLAILNALAERIGETCNIAIPDRKAMLYLDRIETKWPLRIQLAVGTHVPFYCTASGKMYLASLHENHLEHYIRSVNLVPMTAATLVDAVALQREIECIREQGYSQDMGEFVEDMMALAVPVKDTQGRLMATLSFHAPSVRVSVEKAHSYLPLLYKAAGQLTALLSHESH